MPVTINDVAQASNDPLFKGVLLQILRTSDVIGKLPWITKKSLKIKGVRVQNLPTPGFRQWNAGYDEDTADLEEWTDGVFPFGLDIYLEKQFENIEEMIEAPSVTQSKAALRATAMEFNYNFVEGTPAGGGFTGIRVRVMDAGTPARCRISLASGAGDSLKVLASAANEHTFLDALHQAFKVVGGRADMIVCNESTYLALASVLRRLALLDTTKDQFDRTVMAFLGAQLIDIGTRADQATDIIPNTEDPGDGGDDATSLYVVRTGIPDGDASTVGGDGLHGIQKNELQVYDPLNGAEMESRPSYIRRIDWPVTVSQLGDQVSVARVYGFRPFAT